VSKTVGWILAVWAAVLLAAPAALAQEEAGGKRAKERNRRRERAGQRGREKATPYAKMAKVLNLDEATKQKVEEQVAANKTSLEEWKKGDGAKMGELRKAFAEARKAKDKDKAKEVMGELRKLMTARGTLEQELMGKVLALLSEEQKAAWAAYQLQQNVVRRYMRLKLTEEQQAQVKTLCEAASKDLAAAQDGKAKAAAMRKLQSEISEKVLTDEQREKLKKRGGRKPRGEGQAKPKRERGRKKKAEEGKRKPGEMGNPEW